MFFKKLFPSEKSPSFGKGRVDTVKISTFFRKNLWMILLSVLSLFLLLFLFSDGKKSEKNAEDSTVLNSYAQALHEELEGILRQMSGVGKCSVFVTFSDGGETVYACDEDLTATGEKTDSERKYVLISSRSDGLILKVYTPSVLGVAVICEGGDSTRVKNDVTEVISRTLGLSADRISVKKMNP